LSNATISNPGPGIRVGVGAHFTLTLLANETGVPHNWFIDYNNDSNPGSGEPVSGDFNGPSDPKVLVFPFNATRAGSFTYRCAFHPTVMLGLIDIVGQTSASTGLGVGLVPGI